MMKYTSLNLKEEGLDYQIQVNTRLDNGGRNLMFFCFGNRFPG